jgi:hypothetical protein
LLVGVASNLLAALAMERFGVRPTIGGLAVLIGIFAALHIRWQGLPDEEPGVGQGGIFALIRQSPVAQKDTVGSFILYGAWGSLYPILALLSAGPFVQGLISGVARGMAAAFVAWLGRLADRDRQRVMRTAAAFAVGGGIVLAFSRANFDWTLAGLGVAITEVGCNGVAGALKGSLARGEDRVRLMEVGFLFRFVGFGFWPLCMSGLWLLLSRSSVTNARGAVAIELVALLVVVLATVPRLVRRPGTHAIKANGHGEIFLAVFPPAAHAAQTWFYVWVGGSARRPWVERGRRRKPGWSFFGLLPGELITVVARETWVTLLELRASSRGHARARGTDHAELPLAGPAGLPGHNLKVVALTNGGVAVGRLHKLTVLPVTIDVADCTLDELPSYLREDFAQAPREMRPEIDPGGRVRIYHIKSRAFVGERLLINSQVFHRQHGRA